MGQFKIFILLPKYNCNLNDKLYCKYNKFIANHGYCSILMIVVINVAVCIET